MSSKIYLIIRGCFAHQEKKSIYSKPFAGVGEVPLRPCSVHVFFRVLVGVFPSSFVKTFATNTLPKTLKSSTRVCLGASAAMVA
jgi:hypothetical protein